MASLQEDATDTVPNTPEPLVDPSEPFARLTPINRQARLAFDSAVDAIKDQQTLFAHARRNMLIRSAREDSTSDTSVFTDNEAPNIEESSNEPALRFSGAFKFALSNPPGNPQRGWTLGDGRNDPGGQMDFLLSGPRRTSGMAGVHAVIYPNKKSCRLVLLACHSTRVQAPAGGIMIISTSKCASPMELTMELPMESEIRIGDCSYLFEYLDFVKSKEHKQQMATFMERTYSTDWQGILPHLEISPDCTPVRLHKYSWSLGAFAQGTFGQVASGTRSDGLVVAVKRFFNPTEEKLSAHRKLMSYIGQHPFLVELLDCYAGPDAKIPEAYCFYQPLALGTLNEIMKQKKLPVTTIVKLFRQYLEGLRFLHDDKKVMHRDIKPNNLGIVTLNPPVGVIFDLDSATRDATSIDHCHGTLAYLAPEIVALKEWDRNGKVTPMPLPYGRKVDIWALGMSACTSYVGIYTINRCITANVYQAVRQETEAKIQAEGDPTKIAFFKIVMAMLTWEVHRRPSTKEALEAVRKIDQTEQSGISGSKRSRYNSPLNEDKDHAYQRVSKKA